MGTLVWEMPLLFSESNVPTSVRTKVQERLAEILPLFLFAVNMVEPCALRLLGRGPQIIDYAKKIAAEEMLAVIEEPLSQEKN